MNPSASSAAFEGVSGSIIVSVTAFTIVFAVLAGLTAVIYAIKFFSGAPSDSGKGAPSAAPFSAAPAPSAPAASAASRPEGDRAKVVAAVTAAILAATGGRGRVLSVAPEGSGGPSSRWTRTWRTAGLIEQVGNRLSRPWRH